MSFPMKAFWLFCLTFVSMQHNQLSTKVVRSLEAGTKAAAARQTTTTTTAAIMRANGNAANFDENDYDAGDDDADGDHRQRQRRYGELKYLLADDELSAVVEETTRQVSGEIITEPHLKRRQRPAEQINAASQQHNTTASIEDAGGGNKSNKIDEDTAATPTTTTFLPQPKPTPSPHHLENVKNAKNSAKTISENFRENVAKLFENSSPSGNHAGFKLNAHNTEGNAVSDTVDATWPLTAATNPQTTARIPPAVHWTERRHLAPEKLQYTKEISIKQGRLVGIVRAFQPASGLRDVDQYLGLPYAEAPTGSRRFMPPGTPLPWSGLKVARHFPPVCPQKLPDISMQGSAKMSRGRLRHLTRLLPYLQNESEDCLYLNVYVPRADDVVTRTQYQRLFPVIVYIHGESFEWNSGNAYDGTVLASYGEVIVVTVNYRLGLMGFMKPGISDSIIANFGLLDQIAALHWIKENVASFGGDKDKVTLMGHSTGAACVNYLMISPVAAGLFHRAILMSGSAMSDWAASNHSLQLTMQIASALECPLNDDNEQMMSCLRQKSYQDLLNTPIMLPQFSTALGPIVDGHVIPDQPYKAMGQYTELFSRYDLLFGITESESYHTLGALALEEGLRENERDNLLRFYMQSRYDVRPDLALAATLKKYNEMYNNPLRATNLEHRDVVLDILSDARIVGPLMQTGLFHAEVNRHNYMYVFGHNNAAGPYASLPHSIAGEELAFIFGAPLAPAGQFHGNNYSSQEKLLSEAVMAYWTNFAKTGNPKAPWKGTFLNSHAIEWDRYDLEWPEFNKRNQAYMNIGIPPSIGYKYRQVYMNFWNKELPDELNQIADIQQQPYLHGQLLGSSGAMVNGGGTSNGGTPLMHNYPPRRPGSGGEVITGHLSKYGTRDNGAEDPVRTLKLLMQEAGRAVPIGETEAENMYNAPPTFGIAKQSEDEVYGGVQTPLPPTNTYRGDVNGGVIYGVRQTEIGASEISASETGRHDPSAADVANAHDAGKEEVAKSESTLQLLIGLIAVFIVLNLIIYSTFLLQKRRKKKATALGMQRKLGGILSYDGATDDELKRSKQTTQHDGDESYILEVVRKSNTYEAVRTLDRSPINGYKIQRQLSTSTVDTHTKVSEWISAGGGCVGGTSMRLPKLTKKSASPEFSTLRGSSGGGGTTTAGSFSSQPKRISVAVDATPQARSDSILRQEPIEVTKLKAEGGRIIICEDVEVSDQELLSPQLSLDASDYGALLMRQHSTATTVPSDVQLTQPDDGNVFHQYSRSDPVDLYYSNVAFDDEKITSFMDDLDRFSDINVTSRDERATLPTVPLTPEEQLLAIKRRNYPKVLPTKRFNVEGALVRDTDSPPMTADLSLTNYKRNSLPPNGFMPTFCGKQVAPTPPPRTISTLGRFKVRRDSNDITTSPLRLAEDTTLEENEPEPEITQNTLIVGPIVPKVRAGGFVGGGAGSGEGNYTALKHSEPTSAGNGAPSGEVAATNEADIVDKHRQLRPAALQLNAAALQTRSSANRANGLEMKFEREEHDDNCDRHARQHTCTTEKVYSIAGAAPTSPTASSAATTPSTLPATSPLTPTPHTNSMSIGEESRRAEGGGGGSGATTDVAAVIYAQPNKQAIRGSVTTMAKSNIPLRVPATMPSIVGDMLDANSSSAPSLQSLEHGKRTATPNVDGSPSHSALNSTLNAAHNSAQSTSPSTLESTVLTAGASGLNAINSSPPTRIPQLSRATTSNADKSNANNAVAETRQSATTGLTSSSTAAPVKTPASTADAFANASGTSDPRASSASSGSGATTSSTYSTESSSSQSTLTSTSSSSASSTTDTVRTELKQK